MIRLFIAWPIPACAEQELARIIGLLRQAGDQVSWVKPKNIHLTARFLGDDDESRTAAAKLDRVLARFNEGLGDTLDELRNAAPAARGGIAAKAQGIADRYLDYLASDALVAHVESNPFDIDVGARELLSARLNALKRELARIGG